MKQKLIDFLEWYHDVRNDTYNTTFSEDADNYLKSINEHPDECRNIIENEELKEFCSHDFEPKKCWVHKCTKCGELHVEYKNG